MVVVVVDRVGVLCWVLAFFSVGVGGVVLVLDLVLLVVLLDGVVVEVLIEVLMCWNLHTAWCFDVGVSTYSVKEIIPLCTEL